MAKLKELSFNISIDKLEHLIGTLKDLSSIDNKSIFKINNKNTLIYTKVGEGNTINAFKSFVYDTKELLGINDFDDEINYIFNDTKEMYRKLQILLSFGDDVNGKFYYDELGDSYYAERMLVKSGSKLKLNFYGGDPMAINSKISVEIIKETMNVDDSNFNFKLSSDDFANIKRLATSDSMSDIFYMNTLEKDGKWIVSIGESGWDLKVAEIEYEYQLTLAFPKKYFKSITMSEDHSLIYVFDNKLMITTDNSDMLISTEITV